MSLVPTEIKRLGSDGIKITWSDGSVDELTSRVLRENCPSAVSLAKRGDTSHDKPLSSGPAKLKVITSTLDEELKLEQVWGVGNYAIGVRWGDGHDSGIYTFKFLKELAEGGVDE